MRDRSNRFYTSILHVYNLLLAVLSSHRFSPRIDSPIPYTRLALQHSLSSFFINSMPSNLSLYSFLASEDSRTYLHEIVTTGSIPRHVPAVVPGLHRPCSGLPSRYRRSARRGNSPAAGKSNTVHRVAVARQRHQDRPDLEIPVPVLRLGSMARSDNRRSLGLEVARLYVELTPSSIGKRVGHVMMVQTFNERNTGTASNGSAMEWC